VTVPRSLRRYTGETGGITAYPGKGIMHRESPTDPWFLFIYRKAGEGTIRQRLGPCACHKSLDCPVGTQEAAALRILRGDHPDIYTPDKR